MVGFLPVSNEDKGIPEHEFPEEEIAPLNTAVEKDVIPLEDVVQHTSAQSGRKQKMLSLHYALTDIFKPLMELSEKGFIVKTSTGSLWNLYPTIVSYCCDIPEEKDISAVQHGLMVKKPCVRCMSGVMDFRYQTRQNPRQMIETKRARENLLSLKKEFDAPKTTRSRRLEIPHEMKNALKEISISPWPSFLETIEEQSNLFSVEVYSTFTFEPLHNLHLGISKLLKTCMVQMLNSNSMFTNPNDNRRGQKRYSSMKTAILRGCNSLLAAIQNQYPLSGVNVDFSKKEASTSLNGLFTADGLKGMLEAKEYRAIDYVFPFVAAFVDRALGNEKNPHQTIIHSMYSGLLRYILCDIRGEVGKDIRCEIQMRVSNLKKKVVEIYGPHCENGLFTLKFHLLDHLSEDITNYALLEYVDAGPFEGFNTQIKHSFRRTSMRYGTRLEDTVLNMEPVLKKARRVDKRDISGISKTGTYEHLKEDKENNYLVREGISMPFEEMKRQINNGDLPKNAFNGLNKECQSLLCDLIEEELKGVDDLKRDHLIRIKVVKSGFIYGGVVPTLEDYDHGNNKIVLSENMHHYTGKNRIFATTAFGSQQKKSFHLFSLKRGHLKILNYGSGKCYYYSI